MVSTALLLAHADGFSWDEALLVMAPLVAVGGLLALANRRAARLRGLEEAGEDEAGETGGTGEPGEPAEPAGGSSAGGDGHRSSDLPAT